jgi:oxygen-dependent protoporphyrinogen oxidase
MLKLFIAPGLAMLAGVLAVGCSSAPDETTRAREGASPQEVASAPGGDGNLGVSQEKLALAKPSKSLRIAVVGAGPSGLMAADTLQGLGYKNVTVFEKNARVGGKVFSYKSGSNVTDLGAVFASPDYKVVLGLADKYGIPYEAYTNPQYILDENGVKQTAETFLAGRYSTLEILGATAAYAGVLALFSPINNQDGFATIPRQSDLYLPMNKFAAKYGITPIAEVIRSVMIGFGYGYYEDAPAAYYMKLMGWLVKPSLTKGLEQATYYSFPTGYQSIWDHVAAGLDVRLASEVTSIQRPSPTGAAVQITINGTQTFDFDEVIVSAPLNKVSSFMALKPKEAALFSKVEGLRYDVSVFGATGLTNGEALFFHGTANPAGINRTNVWANRAAGAPFVGYQIVKPDATQAEITAGLNTDVVAQGGTLAGVLLRQDWDNYFPHVSTAALQDGFAYKIEALQGDNHTFYVGGTLSFETVEHSARYAQSMVKSHFLPAFLP